MIKKVVFFILLMLSIDSVAQNVQLKYEGDNKKISEAVIQANEILSSEEFYINIDTIKVIDNVSTEYTTKKIISEMKSIKEIEVTEYYKRNTATTAKTQTRINMNTAKLNRDLASITNTLIHETVHAVDWLINNYWDYTHRTQYAENPPKSAPYKIGDIAEKMVIKKRETYSNSPEDNDTCKFTFQLGIYINQTKICQTKTLAFQIDSSFIDIHPQFTFRKDKNNIRLLVGNNELYLFHSDQPFSRDTEIMCSIENLTIHIRSELLLYNIKTEIACNKKNRKQIKHNSNFCMNLLFKLNQKLILNRDTHLLTDVYSRELINNWDMNTYHIVPSTKYNNIDGLEGYNIFLPKITGIFKKDQISFSTNIYLN